MRFSIYIVLTSLSLASCSVGPSTSVQLSSSSNSDASRVNVLSGINKQISQTQTTGSTQKTFHGCLSSYDYKGTKTLAAQLSNLPKADKNSYTITINSDNLSGYVASLWAKTQQNKTSMIEIIDLHRGQDRVCFENEIIALQNNKNTGQKLSISDYQQSRKILIKTYDYIKDTVKKTEYSELDEQFARDHIPVRVLIPTS